MRAVIFEFWPAEGRRDDYFDHVALLREELAKMPASSRSSASRA